ncbi:MAG: glycosyltransferase [Candidatus Micrarchaeota archaeon]
MSTLQTRKFAIVHVTHQPFPVNPSFLGQEFVVGALTANSRVLSPTTRNTVFSAHKSYGDGKILDGQTRVAKGRYNTDLLPSVSHSATDVSYQVTEDIRKLVDLGFEVICDFHYPYRDVRTASAIDQTLKRWGIRDRVCMLGHLHMMADYFVHTGKHSDKSGLRGLLVKLSELTRTLDGIVAVSDAVKQSFVTLMANDREALKTARLDHIHIIRNGIDTNMYVPKLPERKAELREQIGLQDGLRAVVGFVGRLEPIKGVQTLLGVLEHFNDSTGRREKEVGFVVATSDVLYWDQSRRSKEIFVKLMGFRRLIEERRLRLVVDISKFTRSEERFAKTVADILGMYSSSDSTLLRKSRFYAGPIDFPVQAATDITIVPSVSEALSLSTVEAILSGNYAIATNVGGLREVLADYKVGTMINFADQEDLSPAFVDGILTAIWSGKLSKKKRGLINPSYFSTYSDTRMYQCFEELGYDVLRGNA